MVSSFLKFTQMKMEQTYGNYWNNFSVCFIEISLFVCFKIKIQGNENVLLPGEPQSREGVYIQQQ